MKRSQNKMREKKSMWRAILETWPVLLLLLGLVFFFAFGIADFWSKLKDTKENKVTAETELAELKDRKGKLEADIELMATPEGKERIFREDFGLAKEGEGVIVVLDEENEEGSEQEKNGFFGFFKGIFR